MDSADGDQTEDEARWRDWLLNGRPPLRLRHALGRKLLAKLPGFPRCKVCSRPFGGVGRAIDLFGLGPSRKNPHM